MFLDEGALARGGEGGRFLNKGEPGAATGRRLGGTGPEVEEMEGCALRAPSLPRFACFSVSDGFVGVLRARMMQTDFRLAKGGGLE